MKKIIIKNCPAFVLMQTGRNTTYFDMCGSAKGHVACKDCTGCPLKQIVDECKGMMWQNEDYIKISDIINLLEIEEVNE